MEKVFFKEDDLSRYKQGITSLNLKRFREYINLKVSSTLRPILLQAAKKIKNKFLQKLCQFIANIVLISLSKHIPTQIYFMPIISSTSIISKNGNRKTLFFRGLTKRALIPVTIVMSILGG